MQGDVLASSTGEKNVTAHVKSIHNVVYKININGSSVVCSANHRWPIVRDGVNMTVETSELRVSDRLVVA
jgi:hypothetical protein